MFRSFCWRWFSAVIVVWAVATSVQAAPPVSFELVTDRGFSPTESQKWVQFLAKLEITSIRIRQPEPGDREMVVNRGTDDRPQYHVLGVLTGRNRLQVPGAEFSLSDRERMAAWIKQLETEGTAGPGPEKAAFGLTAEQLVAFHEKLAAPIPYETQGRRCGDIARDIVRGLTMEFAVSNAARDAFGTGEIFPDNLRGMSAGTALAAAIRPLGLVFRPRVVGKSVELWICDVRETEDAWPIGWPSEEIPARVAPKFFESLEVKIDGVSLAKAQDAIQGRVGIPFLTDHNGLARQRIDPAEVRVRYPAGRAMYRKVFDSLLHQAQLTSDLRVDEAGQPFLWIYPK